MSHRTGSKSTSRFRRIASNSPTSCRPQSPCKCTPPRTPLNRRRLNAAQPSASSASCSGGTDGSCVAVLTKTVHWHVAALESLCVMLPPHRMCAQEEVMSTRRLVTLLVICAATLAIAVPIRAITDGELDGNRHPAVVLLLMEVNGKPAFRCSGTLLAPTILLTAGHCAGEPGEFSGMRVFTESDVDSGTKNGTNNYPFAGPN